MRARDAETAAIERQLSTSMLLLHVTGGISLVLRRGRVITVMGLMLVDA